MTPGKASSRARPRQLARPAINGVTRSVQNDRPNFRGISTGGKEEADHGERQGPFDGVKLPGADAYWLAEPSVHDEFGEVPNLHLETLYVNGRRSSSCRKHP